MKALWKIWILTSLLAGLVACSSSKTSEENWDFADNPSEESANVPDAGTDAVPSDNPEQPPTETAKEDAPKDTPAPESSPAPVEASKPAETPPAADTAPATSTASDTSPPAATTPASTSSSGEYEQYTTTGGDTLMKIAFETYGDLYMWKKVYEDNKEQISDPNRIAAGTVLKLEKPSSPVSVSKNGEKYLIKQGDTLGKISDSVYGTPSKWKKIWKNNKELIKDPNRIFAGFFLYYVPEEGAPQKELNPQPLAEGDSSGGSQATDNTSAPAPAAVPAMGAAPGPGAAPAAAAPAPGAPPAGGGTGDARAPASSAK